MDQPAVINYKRSRFSTRLPLGRLYTRSHFWIEARSDGVQRVGLTKFATRMLGDLVETGFEVEPEGAVGLGDIIGWVEGLKAASDLYCVVRGRFIGGNAGLEDQPEWLHKDPYQRGWLYEVAGEPEPDAVDAHGYASFLDKTIDQMLGEEK